MISGFVIYPNHVSPEAAVDCLRRLIGEQLSKRLRTPAAVFDKALDTVSLHPVTDAEGNKFTAHHVRLDFQQGVSARFVMAYGLEMVEHMTTGFEDVVLEASSQVMSYVAKDIGLNLFTGGPQQAVIDAMTLAMLYVDSPCCELLVGDYHVTCMVLGV